MNLLAPFALYIHHGYKVKVMKYKSWSAKITTENGDSVLQDSRQRKGSSTNDFNAGHLEENRLICSDAGQTTVVKASVGASLWPDSGLNIMLSRVPDAEWPREKYYLVHGQRGTDTHFCPPSNISQVHVTGH